MTSDLSIQVTMADRPNWRRWTSLMALVLAAVFSLSGCTMGDAESDGSTEPLPTPATPSPTAISGPVELGPIVWSASVDPRTGAPVDPQASMPATAREIRASMAIVRLPAGTQLVGTWTYNRTPLAEMTQTLVAEEGAVEGWVNFGLVSEGLDRWPAGEYQLVVTSDGAEIQRGVVRIPRN